MSSSNPKQTSVTEIKSEEEFKNALGSSGTIFVFFWVTWSGACRRIHPDFMAYAHPSSNERFYTVDVDEVPSISESQEIRTLPTFKVFRNVGFGAVLVDQWTGASRQWLSERMLKARS